MESETGLDAARHTQFDLLVDTILHALRDGDIETVMACLTEDVEYDLVGNSASSICGKDAVRAYHVRELANTMPERGVPLRRLYGYGFVVDERLWEGRITGRVGLLIGSGRRVSHRILSIFEVRDRLVARQTIYSDFVAITRQLA
jgi:hypothetical protein